MSEIQCLRFEDFMQSGFQDKKLKELLQELVGGNTKKFEGQKSAQNKISDDIVQVFRVASKIYCGQLTEEARIV